jgi:hypothetical protein
MLSQKEIIQFRFEFESEWTNAPPVIEIKNNGQRLIEPISINGKQSAECSIEMLPGLHNNVLEIVRSNHDEQTQQICKLVDIKVDDHSIKSILNHTEFYPQYPKIWYQEQVLLGKDWPSFHIGWLNWGWNGTWKMYYDTPFYSWLLKKL